MPSKFDRLPADLKERSAPKAPPENPARFIACAVCGQTYDARNLEQAVHHSPEPHKPLHGAIKP